jgi:hypothetical protein
LPRAVTPDITFPLNTMLFDHEISNDDGSDTGSTTSESFNRANDKKRKTSGIQATQNNAEKSKSSVTTQATQSSQNGQSIGKVGIFILYITK